MPNILLRVAFDGTSYAGWQSQVGVQTLQDILEARLERFLGTFTRVHGSSRTDAGVHALSMGVSFFTEKSIPMDGLMRGLNALLPVDIRIRSAEVVPSDFHARFSAVGKTYQYLIALTPPLPWMQRYAYYRPQLRNIEAMKIALAKIVGTHDFRSLSCKGSREIESSERTIYHATLDLSQDLLLMRVTGDGFLYRMVRSIAGVLIDVGVDFYSPDIMDSFLQGAERTHCAKTAPAHPLFLENVYYDRETMLRSTVATPAVRGWFAP